MVDKELLDVLTSFKEEIKEYFKTFIGEFNLFKEEFNSFKEEFNSFKEEFYSFKKDFNSLKKEFNSFKEEIRAEIKIIHTKLDSLDKRVTKLEHIYDNMNENIIKLKQTCFDIDKRVTKLEHTCDNMNENITNLKQTCFDIDKRVTCLEHVYSNLDESFSIIKGSCSVMEQEHGQKIQALFDKMLGNTQNVSDVKQHFNYIDKTLSNHAVRLSVIEDTDVYKTALKKLRENNLGSEAAL